MYSWPEAEWMNAMTYKEGSEAKSLSTCGTTNPKNHLFNT